MDYFKCKCLLFKLTGGKGEWRGAGRERRGKKKQSCLVVSSGTNVDVKLAKAARVRRLGKRAVGFALRRCANVGSLLFNGFHRGSHHERSVEPRSGRGVVGGRNGLSGKGGASRAKRHAGVGERLFFCSTLDCSLEGLIAPLFYAMICSGRPSLRQGPC